MADLDVALRLRLIDNVSGPARQAAQALRELDHVASSVHGRSSPAAPAVNPAGAPAAVTPPVARPAPVVSVPPPAPARPAPAVVPPAAPRREAPVSNARRSNPAPEAAESVQAATSSATLGTLGLGLAMGAVAFAAGAAVGALRGFIDSLGQMEARVTALEKTYVSIATTAEMYDPAVVDRMRKEDTATGLPYGIYPENVLPIRKVLSGAGYSLDQQSAILPSAVKAMYALDARGENIGQTIVSAIDNLGITPEQLPMLFDQLSKATKQGRFEADQLATFMPSLSAGYAGLGSTGLDASAEILAMAEHIRGMVGSDAEAGNRLQNLIAKAVSPDVTKNFAENYGVDLREIMAQAKEQNRSYLEMLVEKTQELTGGDPFAISQLFGDQQALEALRAVLRADKEGNTVSDLKAEIVGAKGQTDRDAQAKATSAPGEQERLDAISNAGLNEWGKLWQPVVTTTKRITAWLLNGEELRRQDGVVAAGGVDKRIAELEAAIVILKQQRTGTAKDLDHARFEGDSTERSTIPSLEGKLGALDNEIATFQRDLDALKQTAGVGGAAAGEAVGKGLDDGLKAASPAAEATMNGIVDKLKAIGNVTITPSIVPQMGVPSPSPSAPAPAGAPKVEPMSFRPEGRPEAVKRSADAGGARTFAQTNTIHVNGVSDPDATARAIERRLARLGNSSNLLLDTA